MRGEHVTLALLFASSIGPPPRAWRALITERDEIANRRTTSTCVESTLRDLRL
ncbi:hypothetical protein MINT15_30940 [Saccharomonospora viridis]|uniref:Uncharacterized protein n=1 Tax=Saccharomonospora viridis TaxID=1852 RepID=A0A837D601_9PSEU|nr:hypothetical protein MINT15_30940 [Saccharomonospora viridis]